MYQGLKSDFQLGIRQFIINNFECQILYLVIINI